MRTFRFRAWDKEEKKMVHDGIGDAYDNDKLNDVIKNCQKHYILMQYTGLKDKNGTEIYEGDVLKHPEYGTCEVVYRFGSFGIAAKTSSWISTGFHSFSTRSADYEHCEVIGNIYENSNLLSQDK